MARGDKKAASAAKDFKVVDGTVVTPHERVDDDIKAEVEKELGNEAFRDQVRQSHTISSKQHNF